MSTSLNLKEVERKAWRSVFQDGFWDIYLGMLLASMGVGSWLEDHAGMSEDDSLLIYFGIVLTAMLILWAGKRFVTLPRIGQVRFAAHRRLRRLGVSVILGIVLLLGIALIPVFPGVSGLQGSALDLTDYFPILWPVTMLIAGGLAAYMLEFDRLYAIAVLFAISVPADVLIGRWTGSDQTYLAFGIPGLITIGMGLVTLARFLREHPRHDQDFRKEGLNGSR